MESKKCGWADFSSIRFENATSEEHAREIVLKYLFEYGLPKILIEFDEYLPLLELSEEKK